MEGLFCGDNGQSFGAGWVPAEARPLGVGIHLFDKWLLLAQCCSRYWGYRAPHIALGETDYKLVKNNRMRGLQIVLSSEENETE